MSIPLDRLYDHLYHKSNHDIIIYGWIPHGSKKLSDLSRLNYNSEDWMYDMTTPVMIMHDQEPLTFDFWSSDDLAQRWEHEIIQKKLTPEHRDINRIEYQIALGFRGAIHPSSNLYDHMIIAHSEQNSDQIKLYQENGFLPVYYWSHALIAADWFRYAAHDTLLNFDIKQFDYDFLIYNRAWTGSREYRLTFAELLANSDMVPRCLTSFSSTDSSNYYIDHKFKNTSLSINHNRLHEIFAANQHPSSASADYNNLDYACCGIEIVLETLFDDTRWHLTEKTLRPIACGKPFMLAATSGSLQYLKNYGFETFSEYINEDYDLITDPLERLQALVTEMLRIANLPADQKMQLFQQLHAVAKRNQQLFFSVEWQTRIEKEFLHNLNQAMTIMQNNCTGKYWKSSLPMLLETMPDCKSIKYQLELEKWLSEHN